MVSAIKLRQIVADYQDVEAKKTAQEAEKIAEQKGRLSAKWLIRRRNLIPEEIKRLERTLLEQAEDGKTYCFYSLGWGLLKGDPVTDAVFKYCEENSLKCNYLEGFDRSDTQTRLNIIW